MSEAPNGELSIRAGERAGTRVLTVAVQSMSFIQPVHIGDVLCLCSRRSCPTSRPASILRSLKSNAGLHGDPAPEANEVVEALVLAWLEAANGRSARVQTGRVRDRAIEKCLRRMDRPGWLGLTPGELCEIGSVGERALQFGLVMEIHEWAQEWDEIKRMAQRLREVGVDFAYRIGARSY